MYKIILTIICCSLWQISFSQESSHKRYWLPTEGSGRPVTIDTVSPTSALIKMLEAPWKFQFTGKAYYIGYTDLMFSIAHKGDEVIDELVAYYKATSSKHAQVGIIYTLHLIGIEGKIVGRHSETFKNKKARKALLSLLPYNSHTQEIARLLVRDPWLSDVPELINYLSIEENSAVTWPIVKALIRYNAPDFCIGQGINELAQSYTITNPDYASYHLKPAGYNTATKKSLRLFEETYPHFITVAPELFEQDLAGDYRIGSKESISLIDFMWSHNTGIVNFFTSVTSFTTLGSRFVHYSEEDKLYFCSIETAQKRIVDWWSKLIPTEQAFFNDKNFYNRP